jgi:hypothetical protein
LYSYLRNQETLAFIASFYPDWVVDAARSQVRTSGAGARGGKGAEIPSLKLISQNLAYATELERIV